VLAADVGRGLTVREATIRRNVSRAMPFMATERWLMLGVKAGGDRQALHEVIRRHAWTVSDAIDAGAENDLLARLAADPAFADVDADTLRAELDPTRYIGRAPEQVDEFLTDVLEPLLDSLRAFEVHDNAGVTV
jgi:adenylosuccinate lyase